MAELIWREKNAGYTYQESGEQSPHLVTVETCELGDNPPAQGLSELRTPRDLWYNRLIFGDKNNVLPLVCSEFSGQIDLIYIDPPFMTGRNFTSGTQLAYHDTWHRDLDFYLQWLYETFLWLHRLLAPHGSLYVHLDWRTVHYARVLLDEIFSTSDGGGFQSEIIWHYQSGGRSQKHFARKHDTLLLYTNSGNYRFHPERIGERRGRQKRNNMRKEIAPDGRVTWTIHSNGRLYRYDEDSFMTPSDVWSDISHLQQKDPERNGYATQKPEALLKRILLASSEENDLVLDCFCGSGVTPEVAQQCGRRWIACDQSELAIRLTRQRLLTSTHAAPFILQHCIL